jgi:nitroreductase
MIDIGSTDELLSTTRAVRRRLDLERPVDPKVLLECVRLALQAPAAVNSPPWRFLIITEPEIRREIAEIYRMAGAEHVDEPLRTMPDSAERQVVEEAQRFMQVLQDIPVLVLVCALRPIDGQPLAVQMSILGSILPAVWSFQLALRSRGLGSVFTTLHLWKHEEMAKLLGIPDGVTQVALLPVAFTIGTEFKTARRPEPEVVVSWNAWAESQGAKRRS